MSNLESGDTDLTKHDRLVNAWRALGHDANVTTVASLASASKSYASQVRQAIEEGDLTDDEIEAAIDADLVERYREAESTSEDGSNDASATHNGDSHHGGAPQSPAGGVQHASPAQPPYAFGDTTPPQPSAGQAPRPLQEQPQSTDGTFDQIQETDGRYVPVADLGEIDDTLATLADEARFEVQHVPAQNPQHQTALAKLYVARQARELLAEVADEAVPADEV